jgi:hypothetical protein
MNQSRGPVTESQADTRVLPRTQTAMGTNEIWRFHASASRSGSISARASDGTCAVRDNLQNLSLQPSTLQLLIPSTTTPRGAPKYSRCLGHTPFQTVGSSPGGTGL